MCVSVIQAREHFSFFHFFQYLTCIDLDKKVTIFYGHMSQTCKVAFTSFSTNIQKMSYAALNQPFGQHPRLDSPLNLHLQMHYFRYFRIHVHFLMGLAIFLILKWRINVDVFRWRLMILLQFQKHNNGSLFKYI